ncbi:MAG: putative porin [Acidobacteria bacterium]|nr:putative porin [Acidobacteriota bacterium]
MLQFLRNRNKVSVSLATVLCLLVAGPAAWPQEIDFGRIKAGAGSKVSGEVSAPGGELGPLWKTLREQQTQIDQLRSALAEQGQMVDSLRRALAINAQNSAPAKEEVVRLAGASNGPGVAVIPASYQTASPAPQAGAVVAASADRPPTSVAGFRFSGDFRYRLDMQFRSSNAVAGPLQNVRSRYRLRLNLDKDVDLRFRFHAQLSTGPTQNAITNDQDMAGMVAKHLFTIAEAYMDFHPSSSFWIRGGRMEDVFADGMRFLWDDDVRFSGFHQIWRVPIRSGALGLRQIEFRAGEYFLSNPNVAVLSANSPYVRAGYNTGEKVRSANLFHPGFAVQGNLGTKWTHQVTGDIQLYRNANQIQLASTTDGFPPLISGAIGLGLAGPSGGTGNALPASGEPRFFARHFQVVRLATRFERKGLGWLGPETPAWLDFQVSRNVGSSKLRDAMMVSANLGGVRNAGDLRFLYQFAIKDANALISQFTDDDLGTGSGVNIAVHAFRLDLGLTRFLQWQNLLFLQTGRRPSNPREGLFVPLPRGANRTYRYLGQLAFGF